MTTVNDVIALMNQKCPFHLQESWDNSGFLVGRKEAPVIGILVTLDITPETICEAEAHGCSLIVSHHPVIFNPVKRLTDENYDSLRLLMLVEKGIAAICCHTCLDSSIGGVNDVLAAKCGLINTTVLEVCGEHNGQPCGIGRVGELAEAVPLEDYMETLRAVLGSNGLRYCSGGKPVHNVAVGGGACGSMLREVLALGCDTFVTADLKYDHFLEAKAMGLNLIDAGHFPTENPVMEPVRQWLTEAFPDVKVTKSTVHSEIISYA